jgi:hypothetical protein
MFFDLLLAEILEDKRQPVADVVMNPIGDEHPAEISQGFMRAAGHGRQRARPGYAACLHQGCSTCSTGTTSGATG